MEQRRRLFNEDGEAMRAILAQVAEHGPVKAADFMGPKGARSGWWSWKKEKAWLEAWFALGELMIARRVNFHRVYDLRRRVYPAADALELPSASAAERAMVEPAVRTSDALSHDVAGAIASCAAWHGTPEVHIRTTVPAAARRAIAAGLP